MSLVTNVIVLPGCQASDTADAEPVSAIQEAERVLARRLLEESPEDGWADGQGLNPITHTAECDDGHVHLGEYWGGSKYPECDVYAAAFNFLHWDQFKSWIESLPWIAREQVRVLVMEQEDRAFQVWTFDAAGEQLTRICGGHSW